MRHEAHIYLREHRIAAGERRKRKFTLNEVAEELGVQHSTLSKIERGELPWHKKVLEGLAVIYGVEVKDFFRPPGATGPAEIDDDLDRIRQLTPRQRRSLSQMLDALLLTTDETENSKAATPPKKGAPPVIEAHSRKRRRA